MKRKWLQCDIGTGVKNRQQKTKISDVYEEDEEKKVGERRFKRP